MRRRETNIEVLRIFAMVLIMLSHIGLHSNFSLSLNHFELLLNVNDAFILFIQGLGKIGVNIFVIISGFFLIDQIDLDKKKCIRLWTQLLFYSIFLYIISVFVIHNNIFSMTEFLKCFLPVSKSRWWFGSVYFVLYLLSPFLNKALKSLKKADYQLLILLMFILWCIFPTFLNSTMQSNMLVYMVFVYALGAYIRLYYFNDNNSDCIIQKLNGKKAFVFSGMIYLVTYGISFALLLYGSNNPDSFANNKYLYFFETQQLPMLLIALLLFIGFRSIPMGYHKNINILAKTTFGIYLIHDYTFLRKYLWIQLFKNSLHQANKFLIPYVLAQFMIVFILCAFFEYLRSIIIDGMLVNRIAKQIKKI